MNLTEQDLLNPLWLRLREHYEARLATLRMQNDADKSMDATAKLRGRILECKKILALGDPAPDPVTGDE